MFTALLLAASIVQTNPCTAPAGTTPVLNPTQLLASLPEFTINEADGQPRITDFLIGYFAAGATTPAVTFPVAKSAFTLVAGTPDCYRAAIPGTIPTLQGLLTAGLKARRATRPTLEGGESAYAMSNPFGLAPTAPSQPGPVIISR